MFCMAAIVSHYRELLYLTVNVGIIGSVFTFGVVKRKKPVGVVDYGGGVKSLYVCPPTPNCIGTSDLPGDEHYAPPLFSTLFLTK